MRVTAWLVALAFVSAGPLPAENDKPAVPQPKAASADEIAKLIRDLGADGFDTREAASKRLVEIGKDALPALREAAKNDDVEVRNRAADAIEKIDPSSRPRAVPAPRRPEGFGPGGGLQLPGNGGLQFRFQLNNGGAAAKDVQVQENGRRVHIREDADGIKVEVTEKDAAGKETTREFKGKDAEDLKKNAPEAAELYQKYAGGMQMMPAFPRNRLGRQRIPNGAMEDRLRKMMEEALEAARNGGLPGGPGAPGGGANDPLEEMRRKLLEDAFKGFNGRGDGLEELRKQAEELQKLLENNGGLGVPAQPGRPDAPRLGVEAGPLDPVLKNQLNLKGGVSVKRVLPGSRAEKLGLQDYDILQKINGKEIDGPAELRQAIEGAKKLSIEGLRAGKPFKAEEKE